MNIKQLLSNREEAMSATVALCALKIAWILVVTAGRTIKSGSCASVETCKECKTLFNNIEQMDL